MTQWVKNLPAMQETEEIQVQSLVWEDALEEKMATHSSILAWEIPQTEDPGGLQSCCCYSSVASVVSDSVRPHRRQPTRLPVPGILQARTLEWVAISFSNAAK